MRFFFAARGWIIGLFVVPIFVFGRYPNEVTLGALVLLALALLLRVWSRRYIGEHSRSKVIHTEIPVVGGPYAWLGHPLYVSNILVVWSHAWWYGLACSAWWPMWVLVAAFYGLLAWHEELSLNQVHGKTWRKRFRQNPVTAKSWRQAFASDRWTWVWLTVGNTLLFVVTYVRD